MLISVERYLRRILALQAGDVETPHPHHQLDR